jgi:hypothetical protein
VITSTALVTYAKFNTNLLQNAFYLLMLRTASALAVGHLQGARKVLADAAYASAYMIGILHVVNMIVIMKIKFYNF